MANANPSRAGQINLSGDPKALFLKVYAGEVILVFAENNVVMSRTMVRTIEHGKSASFPVFGKGGSEYHVVGTEILGSLQGSGEKIITIDDKLIAARFIPDVDEAMAHYDIRGPYSADAGRALAAAMDKNVLRASIINARTAATVTGGFGGTTLTSAGVNTSATTFLSALFDAAQALREKDVPRQDVSVFLTWDMYYNLINSGSLAINRGFNDGSNGSVAEGTVHRVAGMELVPTNNIPSTNQSSDTSIPVAYRADFTKTVAVVQHKTAVGTVKLIDLKTEMAYDIRRQGDLIVAKYMVGHGGIRPEASVEIALP